MKETDRMPSVSEKDDGVYKEAMEYSGELDKACEEDLQPFANDTDDVAGSENAKDTHFNALPVSDQSSNEHGSERYDSYTPPSTDLDTSNGGQQSHNYSYWVRKRSSSTTSVESCEEKSRLQTRPIFVPYSDDLVPLEEPIYLDVDCGSIPEEPLPHFTPTITSWDNLVQEEELSKASRWDFNSNFKQYRHDEPNNITRHDSLEPDQSPNRKRRRGSYRRSVPEKQKDMKESAITTTKMCVLVLGNGAKEHALAWKLAQSNIVENVYVSPGNGGTATATDRKHRDEPPSVPISNILEGRYDSWEDWADELVKLAPKLKIGLVVIGERQLLLEDAKRYFESGKFISTLAKAGYLLDSANTKWLDCDRKGHSPSAKLISTAKIPCLAPSKTSTILESIDTARTFMKRNNIPCAEGEVFDIYIEAIEYFDNLSDPQNRIIKTSQNLSLGQTIHPNTKAQGKEFLTRYFASPAETGDIKIVAVEDVLHGEEVYATILTDGIRVVQFPLCRVRSRRSSTENAPNTPGMGVVIPYELTGIEASMVGQLIKDTVAGLHRENHDYRGALSIRLFLTSSGPKVVEYRLGFQALHTETLLPLLDIDLAQLLLACTTQTLDSVPFTFRIHNLKACNVVIATDNYPNSTQTNIELSFKKPPKNTFIFHENTKWDADKRLVRGVGGRIYSSVGIGPQMSVARRKALEGMKAAKFDNMVYRKDIGAVERESSPT